MLVSASKHERTFKELSFRDKKYVSELTKKGKGVLTEEDWKHNNLIIPFLKLFYDATLHISGSSYLTNNIYMFEILGIGKSIVDMCASEDEHLRSVAQKMKKKYDKYWGNHEKLNMLLLIDLVFDPRRKIRLVNWMVRRYYNKDDADALKANLESSLKSIYEEYCVGFMPPQGNSDELQVFGGVSDPYGTAEFYLSKGCDNADNELTTYLGEKLENNMEINVLEWWKVNFDRYPILSNIARDMLAIPISTMTSESAFSTGERVVDPYRSSLTPTTIEALICTQDWLKGTSSSLITNEDFDILERFEQELLYTEDGASCSTSSTSVTLEDDLTH
ncbi:zinc finger BED domain-containing protein RICESLEEPER 2-like isoform X2 [Lathyrus oleraceus]|uniref:zinc finger BED domain-containing protein RICESLEEPER 2-like isoform X2 n=1 Tax=Pisum sativum TaxID=3888 RepID=UPI0021CEF8DD|nr:zinc finger BED domain-containing protein RICESLEEPER 2-like isoform X2 [Pisum sativum]